MSEIYLLRLIKVGEVWDGGKHKIMFIPESVGDLHRNHKHIIILDVEIVENSAIKEE